MRTDARIAVLGAGIMGTCLALSIARTGRRVTLIDAAAQPMSGASRWNEGKIHLGYLYAADPSLETARQLMPGGLAFQSILEDLLGRSLAPLLTPVGDLYLLHRDSVVALDAFEHYLESVTGLIRQCWSLETSNMPPPAIHKLSAAELAAISPHQDLVAGFRVPERSIDTRRLGDLCEAVLRAEPRIDLLLGTAVTSVTPADAGGSSWTVTTDSDTAEEFDMVINALWQNRMRIDATAGLAPRPGWSHRYRLAIFARTRRSVVLPSAVIATGPFGDVKNYSGRDFYMSWYRSGLIASGEDLAPPPLPGLDDITLRDVAGATASALSAYFPVVRSIMDDLEELQVQGGWVFAGGRGSLADPSATIHRRHAFTCQRRGSYISVDNEKFSTAPHAAKVLTGELFGRE
jgi:glycine/D-amino acid oxidase-like deaminating enzyme